MRFLLKKKKTTPQGYKRWVLRLEAKRRPYLGTEQPKSVPGLSRSDEHPSGEPPKSTPKAYTYQTTSKHLENSPSSQVSLEDLTPKMTSKVPSLFFCTPTHRPSTARRTEKKNQRLHLAEVVGTLEDLGAIADEELHLGRPKLRRFGVSGLS